MNIFWLRVLLWFFATWFISIVAAEVQIISSEPDPYFFINQDGPDLGGCTDAQVEWVREAYREATMMIRGAMNAIDFVRAKRDLKDETKQQRWDKIATEIIQMFGISVHPLFGVRSPKRNTQLTFARAALEKMVINADDPIPDDPADRMKIFCNDKMMAYLKPSDIFPSGKNRGKKVSEAYPEFLQGVFFQPGKTEKAEDGTEKVIYEAAIQAAYRRAASGPYIVADAFCGNPGTSGVQLMTNPRNKRIIVCPSAFGYQPTKDAQVSEVGSVAKGFYQDMYVCGSRLFVHELVHLWNDFRDVVAVDMAKPPRQPGPVSYKNPRPKQTGINPNKVYWFDRCYDPSDNYPDETTQTAETYAVFAHGRFFPDWRWESPHGEAVSVAKPVQRSFS